MAELLEAPARAAPVCAPLSGRPRGVVGMAESGLGWDSYFDLLPDEVVVNIFSYFSFNELLDVLQNVCVRWKRLVHTPVLWLDKEYVIRGRRWRLEGRDCCGTFFSECRHCRCHKADEEVLQAAGSMPQLRRLTVMRAIKGRILRRVCEHCPHLTSLQIECSQAVSYAALKHIFEKCPKIQKLKLPAGILSNRRCAQLLSGLTRLTCLIVVQDFLNSAYVQLRTVADACQSLKEFHTDSSDYDLPDMEYFLKAKRHTLTSATLYWNLGIMEKWCPVQMLKRCETSLRRLRLLHFYMKSETEAAALEALGELPSLRELDAERVAPWMPHLLSLPFRPGCLTNLERLSLKYASNLQDDTVIAISQGCPNLRELRLMKSEELSDIALTEIYRLKHLEILEVSGCNGLGGTAVALIALVPGIRTLVLQMFNDLGKLLPSLQQIVNMTQLRCLDIFNSRNISAVPFDEFPDRLVNLRELHVAYKREEQNITELRQRMPHLRIFNTFRESEDYFSSGIEIEDSKGYDKDYSGDDFYYGLNYGGDADDEDDDDEDD